ncbi:MAG: hypothetical protein GY798_25770, partial [Hyphomicrobiales bacterium]|nr:hypothetical protein [Hyphomicrobiales bacterium]
LGVAVGDAAQPTVQFGQMIEGFIHPETPLKRDAGLINSTYSIAGSVERPQGRAGRIGAGEPQDRVNRHHAAFRMAVEIEDFRSGLLKHCVERKPAGIVRKAGVMGIVLRGGLVRLGNAIEIDLPPAPHRPLVYRVPETEGG